MANNKYLLTLKTMNADRRVRILFILCFAVFAVLTFRLWSVQIYRHEEFKARSERNFHRILPVLSERGKILDRNGHILAEDTDFWDVWLPIHLENGHRAVTEYIDKSLHLLSEILEKPYESLKNRYMNEPRDIHYKHYRISIVEKVPFEKYVALQERRIEFPNKAMITTVRVPQRKYKEGELAAHILGHNREINAKELEMERYQEYKQGDRIGKQGIEEQYETYLRGTDGENLVFVNKNEIQQAPAKEIKPAIPGNNVLLNIDMKLQRAAEYILGASKGVMVAMNPRDGAVLAMASYPRFDPNTHMRDPSQYNLIKDSPLLHRAIQGTYEPGSVFKVFETVPILEDLHWSPETEVYCPGHFRLPGVSNPWDCHKKSGHGNLNIYQAVAYSCNVFFYKVVGDKLGIDRLAASMADFGFHDKTGIDLPDERNAVFPSRATKRRWYPGYTINCSIGQGEIELSPIQICTAVSAIANRGTLWKPRVAKEIRSPEGNLIQSIEPQAVGKIEASKRTWDIVHESMYQVINLKRNGWYVGTGRHIIEEDDPYPMAGKTGTAQDGLIREPHAWFVMFAPYENPEIAIAVVVENAGHGGEVAAPLAKDLLKVYQGRIRVDDLVQNEPPTNLAQQHQQTNNQIASGN